MTKLNLDDEGVSKALKYIKTLKAGWLIESEQMHKCLHIEKILHEQQERIEKLKRGMKLCQQENETLHDKLHLVRKATE